MAEEKILLTENKLNVLRENNELRKMEIVFKTDKYFSITGTTWEKGMKKFSTMGCIHDEILETIPQFKKIIDLHLSNLDGVPMHSVENGWYWAGGTRWNGEEKNDPPNVSYLAKHLRIDETEAQNIIDKVLKKEMSKDEFTTFVESQKERWKQEAQDVLKEISLVSNIVDLAIEEKEEAQTFKM